MKLMLYEEWIDSIHEKDGISKDRERQMRFEAVNFMTFYGIFFKLPQKSIAKGIVIFHQVSKQISFKKFDRLLYGAVCIFLTSKLDDFPRPLKEFIKAYDYIYNIDKNKTVKSPNNHFVEPSPEVLQKGYMSYKIDTKRQADLEEKFCVAEFEILKTIGYDLNIELPYQYLDLVKNSSIIPNADFLGIANNFLNDTMRTLVCLYFEPRVIALAALKLASCYLNYKFPDLENQEPWYKCFGDDVSLDLVEEVTLNVMDLYKRSQEQEVHS